MSNVKEGDMAYVVAPSKGCGAIVEVVERADWSAECSVVVWTCRTVAGVMTDIGVYAMPGTLVDCHDVILRRIDPKADDTTDETHTNKEAETL